jgi:hypothetical protein
MMLRTWRWLWLLVALATAAGCCGDDDDDTQKTTVTVANQTQYFLHVLQPGLQTLYLPPGNTQTMEWAGGDQSLEIVIAAGQDAQGSTTVLGHHLTCCNYNCGKVTVTWTGTSLENSYEPLGCDAGVGGGSCPYVYSWDGTGWAREAEMLVGALNRGAQRDDGLALTRGLADDGARVRIVTERRETNYLDRIRLEVWEHSPEVELALDEQRHVVPVAAARPVTAVTDGQGRPTGFGASAEEIAAATRRGAPGFGAYRLTRHVDVGPVPEGGEPVLLLTVQNTEFIQDAYHGYMRQFGPGLPKLMRLASGEPTYPFALAALLQSAGFGLEVAVSDGRASRVVGTVTPVGPAGPRTVAVPLGRTRAGTALRVRLTMLPAAWTVHEARVGVRRASAGAWRYVAPSTVVWRGRDGATEQIPLATVGEVDGRDVAIGVGEHVEARFPATPPAPGSRQTAVLRVSGYYEELDRSRKPCIKWGVLQQCLREENAFARFALARLGDRAAANAPAPRRR